MKDITIAILAKDKAYCLPFYLDCILSQEYPKKNIHLYIRTNDNKDNTEELLDSFVKKYGLLYKSVFYDSSSIDSNLHNYAEHDWVPERFRILAKIRQNSIEYAKNKNSDYFVVDCDNFIVPNTIERLREIKHLGIVGPLLRLSKQHGYANYHNQSCPLGYFQENEFYNTILNQNLKGLIEVDTVHCTYYIEHKFLSFANYFDNTSRYEYAIFSNNLRNSEVPQYIDNRHFYGFLFLSDQIPIDFTRFIDVFWKKEFEVMGKNKS